MIRLRSCLRVPHGVRPWATGLALAAAGPAWAAPSAVETLDTAAMRELGLTDDGPAIRPASAEDAAPRPLPAAKPASKPAFRTKEPGPITRQYQVMRELEEMYRRDGRGPMPSLRMQDAPNTRLPNGQRPAAPRSTSSGMTTPSGIQQTSSPPSGGTTPKATRPSAKKKSGNPITNFFSGRSSSSGSRQTSSARRSSKPSSTSTVSGGGMFDRILKPFRGEEEKPMTAQQPPVPPPLPGVDIPATPASPRSTASQTSPANEPFVPAPSSRLAGPVAPAPPADVAGPAEDNPFADVQSDAEAVVIETAPAPAAAPAHPLEDSFVDIRGEAAPEETAIADLDPEFATPIRIHDRGAPRPLDPEAVSSGEEIAPAQVATPPAAPAPQQSPAARMAELQRKLAERSGLGGFQGFCPVALRDRRELTDSRPEFLSVYQNRTYELSSAEAKARFEADPARYAPVNSGNDVVLTTRGETEAEGSLTHAVWFKDRLYLFRTAETLREFNAEPTKYAAAE